MAQIIPKELRKITTGQIFAYTPELAKRKDMIPHWPNNVDPNVKSTGLSTEAAKDIAFQKAFDQAEKEIKALQDYIKKLEDEKSVLLEENQRLLAVVNNPPPKVKQETTVPDDVDRQALINEAVKAILEDKAEGELTTTGMPRIEAIEARCGLANVNAAERELAMKG